MITRFEGTTKIADITTPDSIDTGLVDVPWSSSFKDYQDNHNNRCQIRKFGNMVEIFGAAAPTADIPYSTSPVVMATAPEEFRPTRTTYFIQQGSGDARWLLTVSTNGDLEFARYADSNGGQTCTTTNWLPFYVNYLVRGNQ